jgi:hypothetical protein
MPTRQLCLQSSTTKRFDALGRLGLDAGCPRVSAQRGPKTLEVVLAPAHTGRTITRWASSGTSEEEQ